MRFRWVSVLSVLALAGFCLAQTEEACVASPAATVSHGDHVIAKTVLFTGDFGKMTAHVFLPDTTQPVPGIAFSQSAIQYSDSQTDLLPFARALARAGAASIMIDGTIDWHTPNNDSKRPWAQVRCAFRWLIANTNVDLESLAMGGPILLPEEYVPVCPPKIQKPCYEPGVWVNYGFDDPDAVRATKLMKTPQTQLQITPLVTGTFHLKDVQLQWLAEIVAPPTVAQR